MDYKPLKRNFFQRILGKSATKVPINTDCWTLAEDKVVLDLSRVPELSSKGGAVRLEKENSPVRLLVINGSDGELRAFLNKCPHGSRRLDHDPATNTIQCCSVGKSTFDYSGKRISGGAKSDIAPLYVAREGGKLLIDI